MTRKITAGAELQTIIVGTTFAPIDGYAAGTTTPAIDTSTVMSGSASYRCDGTSTATSIMVWPFTLTGAPKILGRLRMQTSAYPTAAKRIAALTIAGGSTAFAIVKMDATGHVGLFQGDGTTQIGSYSTDAVATNTPFRLRVACQNNVSNDVLELYLEDTLVASTSTNSSITTNPTELRAGWLEAPGQTASMWVDDVAVNDSSGSFEKDYPPTNARVLLGKPVSVITNTSSGWKSSKSASTAAADLIDALNNTPPLGVAHTTVSATNVQVYNDVNPVAGTPHNLTVETGSFGRIGVPGNVQRDTLSGTFLNLGDVTANTRRAQGLYLTGTVASCEFNIRKVGTPTDNLVLEMYADSAGLPSGSALSSVSVDGATLSTTATWVPFGPCDMPLTTGTKYWLVLRRSGSIDASNYYQVQTTTDSYLDGGTTAYNGSTWGTVDTTNRAFRCYSATGNAIINSVYATACTGEAGSGTKNGTIAVANPTIASFSFFYGSDGGAAGTFPGNNWYWMSTTLATNLTVSSMALAPQITLAKTNSSANAALCCGLYAIIEYTDPQVGWAQWTKTADSSLWWTKYAAQTLTMTQSDGTLKTAQSGEWFAIADPMPASDDPTTIVVLSDATLRSGYTPV